MSSSVLSRPGLCALPDTGPATIGDNHLMVDLPPADLPPAELSPAATVTYEFHDSSVPPPYHRSYVLTFDHASAHMVVDSYGDVVADRTAAVPPDAWSQVVRAFPDIRNLSLVEPEQGCTGGTSFVVNVADGGVTSFRAHGSNCGGVNSGAAEKVAEWVGPVRALFGPMNELAPDGPD